MRELLNHRSLSFQYHDAKTTMIEGLLARGDRRLSKVLYDVYRKGAIFDAWTEWFDNDKWMQALIEDGIDIGFYTTRERELDELFPWDFIDAGVTKEFMKQEYRKAKEGQVTPNCKAQCSGCGAMVWKGGICIENKNEV